MAGGKISVIVPVFMVEKYLVRCLESLSRQSFQEIEFVLVDDASPDRCGEICEEYAAKDKRFRVIHHSVNKGLSAARNTGIFNATSDFLMFVDSDDYVYEDFCKLPYETAIKYQADLVMFGYKVDLRGLKTKNNIVSAGHKTRDEAMELSFTGYGMVAWNKLYRKSLFNDVFYPEGVLYEDTATTYKLIWKAVNIYCIDKILYYHCRRPGSLTERQQSLQSIRDKFVACWQQCNDLCAWGYSSANMDLYRFNTAFNYCMKKVIDFSDVNYVEAAQYLQGVTKIPKSVTLKQRLLFSIYRFSPRLFSIIFMMRDRRIGE